MKFIIGLCLLTCSLFATAQKTIEELIDNPKTEKGLIKKHEKWYSAYVINDSGDTLNGRIKEGYRHTSVAYGYRYSPIIRIQAHKQFEMPYYTMITPVIIISPDNIKEDTIPLSKVREICVYALPDTFRYITLMLDTGGEIFRVLADGPVKLLNREYFINGMSREHIYAQILPYKSMITPTTPFNGYTIPGINGISIPDFTLNTQNNSPGLFENYTSEAYYEDLHLYYNDSLIRKKVHPNPFDVKKKDPEKIAPYLQPFADCPEFVNEVSGEKYRELYIEKVIQKGNECLKGK